MSNRCRSMTRREMLASSALAPLALRAGTAIAQDKAVPALYRLSINIEMMFPAEMPRDARMNVVAATGEKAFSFWRATPEEQNRMLEMQQKTGLKCGSVSGNGPTVGPVAKDDPPRGPSATKPGLEKAFLDDITVYAKVAQKFGGADAILLLGKREPDIPWTRQRSVLVSNLRKAGDIAGEYGIVLAWELLGRITYGNMVIGPSVVWHAAEAYEILEEVNHPQIKFDFDIALLQMAEGNIITNLKLGFQKGLIQLVEIGDVPGRTEIGLGELNYVNIFRVLREAGYKGWVGTEHSTSSTPEHAIASDRKLAFST